MPSEHVAFALRRAQSSKASGGDAIQIPRPPNA
jgi:hypothetical protein